MKIQTAHRVTVEAQRMIALLLGLAASFRFLGGELSHGAAVAGFAVTLWLLASSRDLLFKEHAALEHLITLFSMTVGPAVAGAKAAVGDIGSITRDPRVSTEINQQFQRVLKTAGRPASVREAVCDDAARRIAAILTRELLLAEEDST